MMFKEIKEVKKEDRNINSGFDPKVSLFPHLEETKERDNNFDPKAPLFDLEIDEDMKQHIKELWKF